MLRAIASCILLVVAGAAASPAGAAQRRDGAQRVPITGLSGSLQNPCWSPQGDRLAITQFTRRYNEGRSVVRTVASAGGGPLATLSPTNAQSVNLPGSCWNAASDLVTYTSDPRAGDQVFVVPAAGGAPRAITRRPVVAFEPSFSPDGRFVVFERFRPNRSQIWRVGVDGSGLRRLTSDSNDRQPNWSPRGDRIVFQRHRRGQVDLYTVDPNGRGARNLTRTRRREETDVSWSPSGRYLVFSSDGGNIDRASLFTIGAGGGGRRQLTRTSGIYDGAPSWSPDGARIAFESVAADPDGSRGTRIWTIAAPPGRF